MTVLPSRIHPDTKNFVRLPGSIYVPLYVANAKIMPVASGDAFPYVNLIDYEEPAVDAVIAISATHPRGEPMLASVPRLRCFFHITAGAGTFLAVMTVKATAGEAGVLQKATASLSAGGTNFEMFEEPVYTKHLKVLLITSGDTVTLYSSIGLLYGPD